MATLVFGALGTLVGGPLGGAIGSLIGREVDRQIIGVPARESPRLKELAVSTSTYGQPLPRLFGVTRAAGTILWSTEMRESRETHSGGKGQPKTTQYSYTISLAIALSSRPIERIGRIWADGNLLRGEAGDLKTGGTLRVHLGHGDQAPDQLLAAALGARCPAHRGFAYAVFEDLQLGDFGNRIPALSFEVFADGGGARLIPALLEPTRTDAVTAFAVPAAAPIAGFAHDGGSLAGTIAALGQAVPLVAASEEGAIAIGGESTFVAVAVPPAIAWPDGEFGTRTGRRLGRERHAEPIALRYYDAARDYQPGLQRAPGRPVLAGDRTLELPITLSAAAAAGLIDAVALRARAGTERTQMRVASLDPALAPGRTVSLPGQGRWRIESWEWRSGGVELDLTRLADTVAATVIGGDPGTPWQPADRLPSPTHLLAFELPWDGSGSANAARLHVAVGSGDGRWGGAALYAERAGALDALGTAGPLPAVLGVLAAPLPPSPALLFEAGAAVDVLCSNASAEFASIDEAALARGANRLLVGGEILQFMTAAPLGGGRWRLTGLLRGRGASEAEARAGHGVGTPAVLLDERVQLIDAALVDPAQERLAAIGAGDSAPVFAAISDAGRSRRPLAPVHPVAGWRGDGALVLEWTRRARGAWHWADGVDVPLIEESETYEVLAGPETLPLASWTCAEPRLAIAAADLAPLPAGTRLWVRQIGTHAHSAATPLHILS